VPKKLKKTKKLIFSKISICTKWVGMGEREGEDENIIF
jgi:hypothetical protein